MDVLGLGDEATGELDLYRALTRAQMLNATSAHCVDAPRPRDCQQYLCRDQLEIQRCHPIYTRRSLLTRLRRGSIDFTEIRFIPFLRIRWRCELWPNGAAPKSAPPTVLLTMQEANRLVQQLELDTVPRFPIA